MKKPNTMHKIAMGIVAAVIIILIVFLVKAFALNASNVVPTSAQVSQITVGMQYSDVKHILGCDGRKVNESGTPGAAGYSVTYSWGKAGSSSMVSVEFDSNGAIDIESNL